MRPSVADLIGLLCFIAGASLLAAGVAACLGATLAQAVVVGGAALALLGIAELAL